VKWLGIALAALVLAGCASRPKGHPPVCVEVDTSVVKFTLPDAQEDETVLTLATASKREIQQALQSRGVPLVEGECQADRDTMLRIRLDTVQKAYAGTFQVLTNFRTRDVYVSYRFLLQAPGRDVPLEDFGDYRQARTVGMVAQIMAEVAVRRAKRYY
jgi:hypothetical protein